MQTKLGDAIGFEYRGAFGDFYNHETPPDLEYQLNARRRSGSGNDRGLACAAAPAAHKDQFTRCPQLFELLKIYGYETDDGWFEPYQDDAPSAA